MSVLSVQNITKAYGAVKALKDISFEVQKGEIFGLIGPDGAGKTTVFRILTTLLKPDSGKAEVLGKDVVLGYRKIRSEVGYMPGRFSLYQDLTVEENLQFFASVFGTTLDENYDLIKPIYSQLEPFRDRLAGALSGGMKQKLALSCALIHKPEVLFLDEPTTGVDAVSRKEFWEMLHRLREQGISILVSTPYMDEAEQCDRIGLLQEGRLLSIDTPQAITNQFDSDLWAIKSRDKYQLIQVLRKYEHARSVQPFGDSVHYSDARDDFDKEELTSYLHSNGINRPEMHRITPHIEDTFIRLMEKEVNDG
ncbi:ABC transporter ATP-binding protein [Balneolaceae bacterium YR4-1]|uniref:ABC transporter ATP-binding protein n=1 Tax=Halalkalibaculum roseum TaxID=2709311 RepID=A0A6M1TAJ5_9BACT|nr:ABC transporter ATP-binding protein [Halalkalibaculum roseum]NGP77183.1 ABC transporter ATP-binding protein [Halalkalibaculum roseum]